ncbi:hypothetical protein GCM10023142_06750 [Anaerocolumna aminovalerica]
MHTKKDPIETESIEKALLSPERFNPILPALPVTRRLTMLFTTTVSISYFYPGINSNFLGFLQSKKAFLFLFICPVSGNTLVNRLIHL